MLELDALIRIVCFILFFYFNYHPKRVSFVRKGYISSEQDSYYPKIIYNIETRKQPLFPSFYHRMSNKGSSMEESFEWKENGMVMFTSGDHPIYLYFQGDYDIRVNAIFDHPKVECFACVYEEKLTKGFLSKRIIVFKSREV